MLILTKKLINTEVNSFDDVDIPEELLRGICSHGLEIG